MKISSRQRWMALIALLTMTVTAAAWVREGDRKHDAEVVEAPARQRQAQAGRKPEPQTAERLRLEKLHGRDLGSNSGDAFATRNWRKPAPKAPVAVKVPAPAPSAPPAPAAPPAPSAPPLPFAYIGKLLSDDDKVVFLTQGERNLIAHEGETIESTYRVDKISDTRLIFTHLPSGIQQTLSIGEPQ